MEQRISRIEARLSAQDQVKHEFPPQVTLPCFCLGIQYSKELCDGAQHPLPTQGGGVSRFWGAITFSQPTWNFQSPTVVDHILDTRSIAATDFREGEGSTKRVRRIRTTVPTLLLPFLQEILRIHTKQVFSGDQADFSEWRKA